MSSIRVRAGLAACALPAALVLAAPGAHAQTLSFVNGFSKNGSLRGNLNAQYPADGVFSPGAFSGITFDITADAQGHDFAGISSDAGNTAVTVPVGVFGVSDVYTLLEGYAPNAGQTGATVTFTGSAGATQTFTLVNGTDVRDFYQGSFANTVNGTSTRQAFSVTDQGGAGNAGGTPQTSTPNGLTGTYVLDAQHFTLSSAFATQTLTGFTVTDGPGSRANFLSAVTVLSSAPEPSQTAALTLGALGLSALALHARRRRARAA